MTKPQYSLEARANIAGINAYIKARNPAAAVAVIARIRLTVRSLAMFPRMGHPGIVRNTYEITVRGLPYVIVYELKRKGRDILILGVFHGARDR